MTPLTYSTLVQDGIRRAGDQRMPGGDPLVSSPLTSTLITGDATAVLVDPPLTQEQTRKVGDWIEQSGKRLAHIYITHRARRPLVSAPASCCGASPPLRPGRRPTR